MHKYVQFYQEREKVVKTAQTTDKYHLHLADILSELATKFPFMALLDFHKPAEA